MLKKRRFSVSKTIPRNRVQHQKGLSDDAFEQRYPDERPAEHTPIERRRSGRVHQGS